MDMLSICRRRQKFKSPELKRKSPRLPEQERKWGSCDNLRKNNTSSHSSRSNNGTIPQSNVTDIPAFYDTEDGNVAIRIMTECGAKQNAIKDVGTHFINIHIAAPARDSQANFELVDYLSKLLAIDKRDIFVENGLRSKLKTIKITKDGFKSEKIKEVLSNHVEEEQS